MDNAESLTYEKIEAAANFVLSKIPKKPKVGIICGSGLALIPDLLEDKIDIPYEDIPGYPACTAEGHASLLTYGTCEDLPVVCFRGRFHLYEGHSIDYVVLPIRLLKLLGAELVILTNAASGINKEYAKGDVVLIKDHINFVGYSGINPIKVSDERWGSKFINIAYNKDVLEKAKNIFANCGFEGTVHEGVYACLAGPSYETVAEANMLKLVGVDVVGMSTVPEVLAAMQCGLQVLAFSVVTDLSKTEYDDIEKPRHKRMMELCEECMLQVGPFLESYLKDVAAEQKANAEGTKEEETNEEKGEETNEEENDDQIQENLDETKEEVKEEKPKKKSCECKDNPLKKK